MGERPALIVGIGASAGGLEAFRAFFTKMPAKTGIAFVLVQHLSPDHKSLLAELLDKSTELDVIEATDGIDVKADCVFVIPPDATMTVKDGRLKVVKPAPPRGLRRPIDTFLQSLAEDRGEEAVCIILSGTGSDGTQGVASIKERGGLTLAQADFDHQALPGMPQSAAASGQVDDVLAVEEMPARLIAHKDHLQGVAGRKDGDGARTDAASHMATIMGALRARTGHDFGRYKEKTLIRRLQRRMQVLQVDTPAAYIKRFRADPEELDQLFREMLIGVTQFFRDPEAFDALNSKVLSGLAADRGADDTIRIWVPGCATGEEAYSIAILLREAMDPRRPRPKIQIFATDIDDRAVALARLGRYRKPVAGISPERFERWFLDEGEDWCIVPEIREMCVFSAHSIIKHPPFSRLDLISCRNLLIYMDATLQDRVMRTFHYALKPGGRLFLGSSESVTRSSSLFDAVDKKNRIFMRREVDTASLPELPGSRAVEMAPLPEGPAIAADDRIDRRARRLMEKHYPPHIVIDRRHQIVRFSGGAMGQFLEPTPGPASFGLFDMLRKPLRAPVRSALQQSQASNAAVRHENVPVRLGEDARLVTIIAEPMAEAGDDAGFVVVAFQDGGPVAHNSRDDGQAANATDAMKALEQELLTTRTQLQSAIDELEIANEELKSSNEEFQSVNEELQSSNEELETAKEEMQSVNEELQTINVEMSNKNELLIHLNSDNKNLLDSTEIATLFLDGQLRIKSFTRGVVDIFHVREGDIGRPITEIVSLLDYDQLRHDVSTVLRKLTVAERQIALKDGKQTFVMRMRPYRTVDNMIDGVVLTFIDITEREAIDAALRDKQDDLRRLIDSVADGVYCIDRDGAVTLCNAAFLKILGFKDEADVIGVKLHDLIQPLHADGSPYLKSQSPICRTARTGEPAHREDELFFRTDGSSFPVEYWSRPILRGGVLEGAVCTFVDITARRAADEQKELLLKEMDHRVKNLFAIVGGVVTLSARSAETPKELASTIQGRLGALASAHVLIRASKPDSARTEKSDLETLVRTIVEPHVGAGGEPMNGRAVIEGPDVPIGGEAVTSLALVLHELSTNAAKYGAFSKPEGRIHVSWGLAHNELALVWQERGGPPVKGAPKREGFGSQLARRSVNGQLRGRLSFDWDPEGVTVHLSAPLERLTPQGG